jgi:hypothetical protein
MPVLLSAAMSCTGGNPTEMAERRITVSAWDTLFFRPLVVDDSVLPVPDRIDFWRDGVVVSDFTRQKLLLLGASGEVRAEVGRKGSGPEEFAEIRDIFVVSGDTLWVLDAGNRRLTADDPIGAIRSNNLADLPSEPWSAARLSSGFVVTMNQGPRDQAVVFLDRSFQRRTARPVPWTPPLSDSVIGTAWVSSEGKSGGDAWVSSLLAGPGFAIWNDSIGAPKPYIARIPLQKWLHYRSPEEGDSSVDGSRGVYAAAGRIYVLTGGRPRRRAHPASPTQLIDVYDSRGSYLETYRLPGNTTDFAVRSGTIAVVEGDPTYSVALYRAQGSR